VNILDTIFKCSIILSNLKFIDNAFIRTVYYLYINFYEKSKPLNLLIVLIMMRINGDNTAIKNLLENNSDYNNNNKIASSDELWDFFSKLDLKSSKPLNILSIGV
jgi:hypothetical protein